jgi:hypothetical protein
MGNTLSHQGKTRLPVHISLCCCLFGLHVVTQPMMHYPSVLYDELLYLGVGRFFAGLGTMPNLYGGAWGHLGYSATLIPAFWLFKHFEQQYHAVLLINAILMTCTYPLLYAVLRRLQLTTESTRWLAPICFAASAYPSFLLFSNFAISENLFTPLFLLSLLTWLRFLEQPDILRAVTLGLAALASYLAHNRGLSLVICSVLFSLVLAFLRRIPWKSAIVVTMIGISTVILVGYLKNFLEANWPPTIFPHVDLSTIAASGGPGLLLRIGFGQLVYLISSTFGLYVFGIGYLVSICLLTVDAPAGGPFVAAPSNPWVRRDAIMWLLVVHLSVYLGSALFIGAFEQAALARRADYVLLGRYNEALLPVFIAAGFLLLAEAGALAPLRKALVVCATSAAVILVAGGLLLGPTISWQSLGGPAPRINILSFMPLYRALRVDNLAVLFAVPCAALLLAALAGLYRRPAAAIFVVAVVFTAEAGFYMSQDIRRMENLEGYDGSNGSVTRIGPLLAASTIEGPVDVDRVVWDPFYFSQWQLFCANRSFRMFHGPTGAKSAGRLVIAERNWRGEQTGYRDVGCEDNGAACLWVK